VKQWKADKKGGLRMKKRLVWIALACVLFLGSGALIFYYLWGNGYLKPAKTAPPPATYAEFTYPSIDASVIDSIVVTDPSAEPSVSEAEGYECPVDFAELQAINPDIIGWIYMTSPEISLPILRSPTDDTQYLYHDAVGEYKKEGSLFVEHTYNSDDFSDLCTVIYGHRMSDGTMFGTMQAVVSEEGYFDEDRFIVIFTPDETKIYQIFATIPSDSKHILYYNDFNNAEEYASFVDGIFSMTGLDVRLVEKAKPTYGDRILVLSSCLWGDRYKRFLVIAKEVQ